LVFLAAHTPPLVFSPLLRLVFYWPLLRTEESERNPQHSAFQQLLVFKANIMLACSRARSAAALSALLSRNSVASAAVAAVPHRRFYGSSCYGDSVYGSSSDSGYTAYSSVEESSWSAPSSSSSAVADSHNGAVAPLEAMNRNARKPTPANHGARPNSNYNRKRSSPEFGSWRHVGLRPGQSPAPRMQPGTPACIAEVATLSGPAASAPASATKDSTKKAAAQ
jgi:hypothetical protein